MLLWLIVLVRVVANPFSNVFQKVLTRKGAHPMSVIAVVHGLLTPACLAVVVWRWPRLGAEFWMNIGAVAVLTVAGNALLVAAVRVADLSVLGPINAYKAVVSLVPAMVMLHEFPRPRGLGGIALIVAGSYFIVEKTPGAAGRNLFVRFFAERGVQYRFAALVLSAVEAVFLKKALWASASAMATFCLWAVLGFVVSVPVVAVAVRMRDQVAITRASARTYAALGLTTGLMQLCTVISFGGLQVGYALALFQTSTLLSVLLGWRVFRERNIAGRLAGSIVMGVGAVLIVLSK
jgi:drug/metabolite transporter (DMT)-like permease